MPIFQSYISVTKTGICSVKFPVQEALRISSLNEDVPRDPRFSNFFLKFIANWRTVELLDLFTREFRCKAIFRVSGSLIIFKRTTDRNRWPAINYRVAKWRGSIWQYSLVERWSWSFGSVRAGRVPKYTIENGLKRNDPANFRSLSRYYSLSPHRDSCVACCSLCPRGKSWPREKWRNGPWESRKSVSEWFARLGRL